MDELEKKIEDLILEGILDRQSVNSMTREILIIVQEEYKQLIHFRDSTCGLWATDRPDKVSDPEKLLFRIEDKKVKYPYKKMN